MTELTRSELRTVQLDILQAVDAFCREKGLRYSIACGTLLGAVRHKGYIPWDDDIDIYMLRADYERFVALFPQVLDGHYELLSLERSPNWDMAIAKVFDNRTLYHEYAHPSEGLGVNIDIFPIDDVPDDEQAWKQYEKRQRFFQKVHAAKFVRLSPERSLSKNALLVLMKIPVLGISQKRMARFLSRFAQKNNGKGYHSVFECVQGLIQKNRFPKAVFDKLAGYPFEDRVFQGFEDADSYLRNAYGDYMKLPPVEKRVTSHLFEAYWK